MVSVPKLVRSYGSDGEVVAPWQMFVLLEVWVVPGKIRWVGILQAGFD